MTAGGSVTDTVHWEPVPCFAAIGSFECRYDGTTDDVSGRASQVSRHAVADVPPGVETRECDEGTCGGADDGEDSAGDDGYPHRPEEKRERATRPAGDSRLEIARFGREGPEQPGRHQQADEAGERKQGNEAPEDEDADQRDHEMNDERRGRKDPPGVPSEPASTR